MPSSHPRPFFFFRVLARIIFTTDHTFTRQHRRGLLLCYGIACLLSHLASIPTYFSLQLCTCIRKWPFDSHFVPLITFAEAFRIGNLCFEIRAGVGCSLLITSLGIIWSRGTNLGGPLKVMESIRTRTPLRILNYDRILFMGMKVSVDTEWTCWFKNIIKLSVELSMQ